MEGLLGDGPPFLTQLTTERDHVDAFGQRHTIGVQSAGCGLDVQTATTRCWAETVERLVASSPSTVSRRVLERESAPRHPLLAWWRFISYDPELVRELGEGAPHEDDFVCVARTLSSEQNVLVPASRVILHWQTFVGPGGIAGECDATGLAAGTTVHDATTRGLREVLERDAVMRAWRDPTWPGRPVDLVVLGGPLSCWLATCPYQQRFVDVSRRGLDPVVVALLHDEQGATIGSACRGSLGEAVEAAVLEAAMLRSTIDVLGPGTIDRPVESSLDHVRFGYRRPDVLRSWIDDLVTRPASAPVKDPSGGLVDRVTAAFGAEPYVVVLADQEEAPLPVVRVLLPGAIRKEWRHDWRWRAAPGTDGGRRWACHDLPHPFG